MIRVRSQKNKRRRLFCAGKRLASILFSFNLGRDGINTCPCNKFACLSGTLICADDSYICYSAVRRLPDGSEKTETGLVDCLIN